MPPMNRLQSDHLGEMSVPDTALYGPNTARAAAWLSVSDSKLSDFPKLVSALGHVKAAAAEANRELGKLDEGIAAAVIAAAEEVASGTLDAHFPIDIVQGGGGTATNINANEVIAARASRMLAESGESVRVHPSDHVNRSQSSNDVYPTSVALAALRTAPDTLGALERVEATLRAKASEAGDLQRLGRTCLRDALPVPVGGALRAQARLVSHASDRLREAIAPLAEVPLGTTAVGTGVGAPDGFRDSIVARLAARCGLALVPSPDPFDALAHAEPLARVAGAMRGSTRALAKIARDLRLLSSGPRGGIAEAEIPPVLIGSSIMPGKSNPVVPELMIQAGMDVAAAAGAIEMAVDAGELELNVMLPVATKHLLTGLRTIERAAAVFDERCLKGLSWDRARLTQHLEWSYLDVVQIADASGCDAALLRHENDD